MSNPEFTPKSPTEQKNDFAEGKSNLPEPACNRCTINYIRPEFSAVIAYSCQNTSCFNALGEKVRELIREECEKDKVVYREKAANLAVKNDLNGDVYLTAYSTTK